MIKCIGLEHAESANAHFNLLKEMFYVIREDAKHDLQLDSICKFTQLIMNPEAQTSRQLPLQELQVI